MQPSHDTDQWQQPTAQPGAAPYTPAANESPQSGLSEPDSPPTAPIVTLSPDEQPQEPTLATEIDQPVSPEDAVLDDQPIVRWQAYEYIHREKGVLWYAIFVIVVVLLMALAFFWIQSVTFMILIPVMAAALLVYSRRPPHPIDYTLSRQGLHVGDKLYGFGEFKSFTVIHGDDEYSIMLVPTKRFHPGVSVYFPEDAGEAIVDALAARLPMEEAHLDVIDRMIRLLRI